MFNKLLFCIIGLSLSLMNSAYAGSLEVPLYMKEQGGMKRTLEPVTSGVPLSKELNILNEDIFRIVNSEGDTVPAQFRVLSRYDGGVNDATKPIRVVLADFQADADANTEAVYYLKDGGSGPGGAANFLASDNGGSISISTGKLTVSINKERFNLFDSVLLENGQKIVSTTPDDGIVVKVDGKIYSSYNPDSDLKAEIVENGPLRCVVKVKGYFRDDNGNKLLPKIKSDAGYEPVDTETRGLSYTVRLKAYKDKPYLKVEFTIENENKGWSYLAVDPVHNVYVDSCYLKTTLNLESGQGDVNFGGIFSGSSESGFGILQSEVSDGSTNSYDWSWAIVDNTSQCSIPAARKGDKFDGFVDLSDSSGGVMVASRWFWQNYPIGVSANDNVLKMDIFPEPSALSAACLLPTAMTSDSKYRVLGGIWKTHELMYYFHSGDSEFADEVTALKNRLVARCSDEHYASSGFMNTMVPEQLTTSYMFKGDDAGPEESLQAAVDIYTKRYRAKFDSAYVDDASADKYSLIDLREKREVKFSSEKYATWYGWLEFGDTPRGGGWGYSAQHYDWAYTALMGYLRFSDRKMLEIGEELVSHLADIIVIHENPRYFDIDDISPGDIKEYSGGHRYEADALMSFEENYSGSGSSGPRKASHFWTNGLLLQYYLTGEERYREAFELSVKHIENTYQSGPMADVHESRNQSRGIDALVNGYHLTGDRSRLDKANFLLDVLLKMERTVEIEGQTHLSGWISDNDEGLSMNYDTIMLSALIRLLPAFESASMDAEAQKLGAFFERYANWCKDSMYGAWYEAPGTFHNPYERETYFPFASYRSWYNTCDTPTCWPEPGASAIIDNQYSVQYADLFAFMYLRTKSDEWLNLARSVFKDYQFYGSGSAGWTSVNNRSSAGGFFTIPGAAYLKVGKTITKPLLYLWTEWKYGQSVREALEVEAVKLVE